MPNPALDEQAINDTITIEDVKAFVSDVKKKREDFLNVADRSWSEIEKRNRKGKLYGGNDLDRQRRWTKYPLWWSCWKIRQPLVLARLAIPVLKDTQSDNDEYGNTACIIGERLIRGILKTFDCFAEFSASVDDYLVTNFGWGRAFYRRTECVEPEKIMLQVVQQDTPSPIEQIDPDQNLLDENQAPNQPATPIYLAPNGQEIPNPKFDDLGNPYVETGKQITVDNEEVYFEAGLYSNLYVDPDARRWSQVTRLAFESQYSYREFLQKFGQDSLSKISTAEQEQHRTGKPIIVFEYHDKLLKECRWFAETSESFFQPQDMLEVNASALSEVGDPVDAPSEYDNSDLYGLTGFFPCVEPLIANQATKNFWPTPEFFQIQDMLDDLHQIVGRMFLLGKAIRVRFFFDSSIPQLQQLIGETGEGGGLGIPDLAKTLMDSRGDMSALVAYFPVKELIEGLKNMYEAFNQRLDMFYQVTGLSDLIRGQANPDSDKTFGERQMEGKFALNRIEPMQRKTQEWMKRNYQLLMEMALKCFSDETLDEYITPQTLDDEDKMRYVSALDLLKNNKRSRFRVDFETDSTLSINENYKRAQAIETANTITKMMESVAKTAEQQPELAATELKIAKHVIGELTDGKLFIDEVQDSIEQVIEKVSAPQQPEFNPDEAAAQFNMQKLSLDDRFRNIELQTNTQLEMAKLQSEEQRDAIANQLEQIKMQIDSGAKQSDLQVAVAKLQADIAQGWEALNLKKEEMLQVAQKEGGKQALDAFRAQIEARVRSQELTLAQAAQELEAYRIKLEAGDFHASLQERVATEMRLQDEHQMNKQAHAVDVVARLADAMKPEPPKPAPVSVDKSTTIQLKLPDSKPTKPKKGKK
jgi:hypothetical protein